MRLIDADASKSMHDLISRQEAINAVGSMLRRKFGIGGDLAEITLAGLPSAQPTVDAVPVRHGKWTPHEEMSDEWNCSETWYRCQCGYETRRKTPYCPMCGARMDAERKEE